MGMTISEKILAYHAGKDSVKPDDMIFSKVDLVMSTDITTPLSIEIFKKMGANNVFNRKNIFLINDHLVPAKDIASAEFCRQMREFAHKYGINHYFEVGRSGICHRFLPEQGFVVPGDLILGADSHTCTYGALGTFAVGIGSTDLAATWALGENWFRVPETIKINFQGKLGKWVCGKDIILYTLSEIGVSGALNQAIEFSGNVITQLSMADRFTICNMAVEAGAKTGIIAPDGTTMKYLEGRAQKDFTPVYSDDNASYFRVLNLNLSKLEPLVALPPLPSKVEPARSLGHVNIDQVFIGSCTNGSIDDFRVFCSIIKGKKVHPETRLIGIPATQEVLKAMIKEGLAEIFLNTGGTLGPPTCGPCIGSHMGVLAANEKALSTSNRNFVGRMGHPTSEIYLSSPAVAAATAIMGRICHPEEVI